MPKKKRYLALDFGTSRGQAVAGAFTGRKLELECLHRFPVDSTSLLGIRYWNFPGMMINAKAGLAAYAAKYGPKLAGLAADSWGVDFGLLDKTGHLLANPVHHLDDRTLETVDKLHASLPARSVYQRTGVKGRREGTLYQLYAMAAANSPLLDKAVTMLLMADLVSYFFSGVPVQEYTLATTTGMYDAESRDWSRDIILSAHIPPVMVPEIVAPGTVVGPIRDDMAAECGVGETPVIAPGSHATAGAVAAIPAKGDDWLFILSGERNHVGVELSSPLINDDSFALGFSNVGGVDGTVRLTKGAAGFDVLDKCRRAWAARDGSAASFADLAAEAAGVEPLKRVVNLDSPPFRVEKGGDILAELNARLGETGQPAAESRAEVVRLCLDSMALAQRRVAEEISGLTGRKYAVAHLAGDEADSRLLGQAMADACGIPVKAGPVEAKAAGNLLMQAMALGDVGSLAEAREIVAASFDIVQYEPAPDRSRWDEAFAKFKKMG